MSEEEKKAIESLRKNRGVSFAQADIILNLIEKQQKEIEELKKKQQDVKDKIEYYLVGNVSLDNFDIRNKELRKLEKMLGE